MKLLVERELERAEYFLNEARKEAQKATCERAQCGTVIVKADTLEILGRGYNSPPGEHASQRRCSYDKRTYHPRVVDKTCCIHAEVRALHDALRTHPEALQGADLFFARVDPNNNSHDTPCGKPYCTLCSKQALDLGIGRWILRHPEGITSYGAEEYNTHSYHYSE